MGKRRKTSQSEEVELKAACLIAEFSILFFFFSKFFCFFSFLSQEEASRGICDDRPSVAAALSEKKMDSSNHNKVKVMATQLLAKFEENAPAPQTGLKRQVGEPRSSPCLFLFGKYCNERGHMTERLQVD